MKIGDDQVCQNNHIIAFKMDIPRWQRILINSKSFSNFSSPLQCELTSLSSKHYFFFKKKKRKRKRVRISINFFLIGNSRMENYLRPIKYNNPL